LRSRNKISERRQKLKKYPDIKMARKHGGFRQGAGRPKGSRNRATIAREARRREALAATRAENANLMPNDFLRQIIRDPTTAPGQRVKLAKFVAPYIEYRMRRARKGSSSGSH